MKIVRPEAVETACAAAAEGLAAPDVRVTAHLAACSACRATAAALAAIRRAGVAADPDLWPRLRARLAAAGAGVRVQLHFPPFTWEAAAALATIVTTASLAPDAGRLFAVLLGMV